jgi:hypothetical protein
MSNGQPYSYSRLKARHIRLLQILDAPAVGVHCTAALRVIAVPLDDAPEYETLSYVWGGTVRTHAVGLTDGDSLYVTESLARALPTVLASSETGMLWIDQMCINQDDLSERSSQVGIMGEIYKHAQGVLVWLGIGNAHDVGLTEVLQIARIEPGDFRIDFHSERWYGRDDVSCSARLDAWLSAAGCESADESNEEHASIAVSRREGLRSLLSDILSARWVCIAW